MSVCDVRIVLKGNTNAYYLELLIIIQQLVPL